MRTNVRYVFLVFFVGIVILYWLLVMKQSSLQYWELNLIPIQFKLIFFSYGYASDVCYAIPTPLAIVLGFLAHVPLLLLKKNWSEIL